MLVVSLNLFAVLKEGDKVSNFCWDDINEKKVCLDDYKNMVKVLIYNAGWCPPCNTEFKELGKRVKEFSGKSVVFISLSSQGWKRGDAPNTTFLKEWEKKHNLKFAASQKINFVVAAAPGDFGKNFFTELAIPNVAVVDKTNTLYYKEIGAEVDDIFKKVKELKP